MKEKVRIGIIGMGRMGITHYSIINSHPKVEIVSVSDTSSITLSLLKKYLSNLKTYTDYNEQLADGGIDGVIVCTPPNLHYKICKTALEKGIAVFCEKPFTTNPDQARELMEDFAKAGLVNQVGYVNRFNSLFMTARDYISKGLLGNIVRVKSEMFSCTISKPQGGDNWRARRENGGGATYEMAAHALDLVNFLLGQAPTGVRGTSLNYIYSNAVEDIVSTTLEFADGCTGTLYVNWSDQSYRKPSNKLEFFGTNGKLLVDQYEMKIYLNKKIEGFDLRDGWNTIYITDVNTPVPFYVRGFEFTRQLYHFADCIAAGMPDDACDFKAGYETQRVIHQIFDDADNNQKR